MNVNVPAMTASATPACAARVDTTPSTSEPPELLTDDATELLPVLVVAADEEDELEAVMRSDDSADEDMVAPVAINGTEEEDEGPPEMDTDEAALGLALLAWRYGGAATAVVGSLRSPDPQGIA
jgi:hypothetical protein